jgi:prepilin-type N-terminal cleavage/methylation domain-containing protein
MIHNKKGFTLFEMMIVIAMIGLFFAMTSYMTQDVRINQTRTERLANTIYDQIRSARNSMIIGR